MKTQKRVIVWTWVLFIAALFAFALAVAPAQAGTPGNGGAEATIEHVTVEGTIFSKQRYGQPKEVVTGSTISLYDAKYNFIKNIEVQESSNYTVDLELDRTYVIIVKKDGYLARRIKITTYADTFVGSSTEELNVTLTPADYNDPFASRK